MNESNKMRSVTEPLENTPLLSYDANEHDKYSRAKEAAKKCLHRYLPITYWLPHYNSESLLRDIIAGTTVGLMVVPQGLAYATIAGLPLQYGLYSAFMGCFVYCLFGSSKDVTLGPTAIMSLMVEHFAKGEPLLAVALTLYCGIVQLFLGTFRLGFLVRFISLPVISGFVSAAAIIIGFGQVKSLLGLQHIPRAFFPNVVQTFRHIKETNPWDLLLGSCCIVILIVLKKLNRIEWDKNEPVTRLQQICRKFLWILTTARNALVVLCAAAVVKAVQSATGNMDTFTLTAEVEPGIPDIRVPALSFEVDNATLSASEVLKDLGPGLVVVPLIGFLESIAIAKAFGRKNRYSVDASQELIALGIANCVSSFVSSYPVTGSFSRTAVNAQSGVATPAGGIFTGAIVLLALGVLTPSFKYIPKASLAALIMSSVVTMIEYHILPNIWKVRRIDLIPLIITFFGCFYDIEVGILTGIGVALCILLYRTIWPAVTVISQGDFILLKINGNLNYPGVEHVVSEIQAASDTDPPPPGIVIDFSVVTSIDFTVAQALITVLEEMDAKRVPLFFSGVCDAARDVMIKSGIDPGIINQGTQSVIDTINALEIVSQK
ncbi:sodium-independent sulfate anion transporter-like isoform X1 [Porites lutea]|uniref:sodium-independent sulfate anion transporter-like isoform X1 n=1 Tax=Porites lutea TaxID=51062 RepID=UPI003CC58CC0